MYLKMVLIFVQTTYFPIFILNPPAGPPGVSPADVCAEEPHVSAAVRFPVPSCRLRHGKTLLFKSNVLHCSRLWVIGSD